MSKPSKRPGARLSPEQIVERLVTAATQLLAEEGPSEIKARSVAETAQVSTIALYYHLGGMPELFQAVVDKGFRDLEDAFVAVASSEDPVTDLFATALTTRRIAQNNPHLYDLMFGLSTRGSYRPLHPPSGRGSLRSEAFQAAYAHLVKACERLLDGRRIRPGQNPEIVAFQLWSGVHGFVKLELADYLIQFSDPVRQVLLPTTVNLLVGLGDDPERCRASHDAALATLGTDTRQAPDRLATAGAAAKDHRKRRASR
jgi:AcrR family transcriptional regulator